MKKTVIYSIILTMTLICTSCIAITNPPSQSSTAAPTIAAASNVPASIPVHMTSQRAWRYFVSIQTDAKTDNTIMQDGCTTTYDIVWTVNVLDEGLRKWIDGQIAGFIDGVVQDTGSITKAKALFTERGLDKKYPGSTFIRKVRTEVSSMGGVLSVTTSDYAVFRPKDADIVKYELGYMGPDDTTADYNYEEQFAYQWGEEDDEYYVPEAYTYHVKTLCLNLIDRKAMPLSGLFRPGADYAGAINREINRQIIEQKQDENEVLERPFAGIAGDYPVFSINNRDYFYPIQILFNEGNPWFNTDAISNWGMYRSFYLDFDALAPVLNPVLFDDRLLPLVKAIPSQSYNWMDMDIGDRYLPDFGLGQYEVQNDGSSIRVSSMPDANIQDRINAALQDFETRYVNKETILKRMLSLDDASQSGAVLSTKASAREYGRLLCVHYDTDVVCDKGNDSIRLPAVFDLDTGSKLTYRDLVKDGFYQSKGFKENKGKILDEFLDIGGIGSPQIYYACEADMSLDNMYLPEAYSWIDGKDYFDWDKWGTALLPPTTDQGVPAAPVFPAGGVTEDRWGYITKAYVQDGMSHIDIDYVDYYFGEDAVKMAAQDGKTPDANGDYIRNTNTKLRTFPIIYWCRIIYNFSDGKGGNERRQLTQEQLVQGISKDWTEPVLVHITVQKGYVTSIDQQQ